MKKNVYRRWQPLQGIPDHFYLKYLHYNYEGLKIILDCFDDGSKIVEIFFEDYLSYRSIDEGDLFVLDKEDLMVENIQNREKLPEVGGLRIVDFSSYVEWFYFVNQGIREKKEDIIHYGIYTWDDCIDILSAVPPIVKWLE